MVSSSQFVYLLTFNQTTIKDQTSLWRRFANYRRYGSYWSQWSDLDTDEPLQYRSNQKKTKHARVAKSSGLSFVSAVFSPTGQIHQAVRDFMFNQIKLKLELADSQVQSSKIQSTFRFWVTQLACVSNRTAYRSILAGASSLVDSANVMLHNEDTADQREDRLAANSMEARKFIGDVDLSMVN